MQRLSIPFVLVALATCLSTVKEVHADDPPAATDDSQKITIDLSTGVSDALDQAVQDSSGNDNGALLVIDGRGTEDPTDIAAVVARSQDDLKQKRLAVYGSDSALELAELRQVDRASYDEWLSQRFESGLTDDTRVQENQTLLDEFLNADDDGGFADFFECSAELCRVYMSQEQVVAFGKHLKKEQASVPVSFMRVIAATWLSSEIWEVVFIREDIDISELPGR